MKKKLLALILSVSMITSLPGFALANDGTQEMVADQVLEEIHTDKADLLDIKNTSENEDILDLTDDTLDALDEFETQVEYSVSARSLPYEANSIQTRLELFTDIVEAITTSTSELTNKTVEIHNKIGFEITRATMAAANPLTSVEKLEGYRASLKAVLEEAKLSRDITSTDVATIYVKEKLSKAIWQTRFTRDKEVLGKVPFEVYNELNKNITHAVGVQLSPKSTVEEIDLEIVNLQKALDVALSQKQ